jgi:hypothetical protein
MINGFQISSGRRLFQRSTPGAARSQVVPAGSTHPQTEQRLRPATIGAFLAAKLTHNPLRTVRVSMKDPWSITQSRAKKQAERMDGYAHSVTYPSSNEQPIK